MGKKPTEPIIQIVSEVLAMNSPGAALFVAPFDGLEVLARQLTRQPVAQRESDWRLSPSAPVRACEFTVEDAAIFPTGNTVRRLSQTTVRYVEPDVTDAVMDAFAPGSHTEVYVHGDCTLYLHDRLYGCPRWHGLELTSPPLTEVGALISADAVRFFWHRGVTRSQLVSFSHRLFADLRASKYVAVTSDVSSVTAPGRSCRKFLKEAQDGNFIRASGRMLRSKAVRLTSEASGEDIGKFAAFVFCALACGECKDDPGCVASGFTQPMTPWIETPKYFGPFVMHAYRLRETPVES